MSILSKIVRQTTGRSIGENIGGFIGGRFGGAGGAVLGETIGGTFTEQLSKNTRDIDTTQTQTVQSSQGPVMAGPAQAVEIDFGGVMDGGGFMPANFQVPPLGMTMDPRDALYQQAFLPAPAVGVGVASGLIADFVIDLFTGETKKLIITKKLKRLTEDLMELQGNDMGMVADQLTKRYKRRFNAENVLKILTHKFTNQGPYVTKAAVRKTRRTVRKLETLNRLYADVCKPATRTRRRATTTRARASAMAKC
jgi:hypothetical protein